MRLEQITSSLLLFYSFLRGYSEVRKLYGWIVRCHVMRSHFLQIDGFKIAYLKGYLMLRGFTTSFARSITGYGKPCLLLICIAWIPKFLTVPNMFWRLKMRVVYQLRQNMLSLVVA